MIGTFCLNTCPDITSILSSNLDFLIIDREHGRASLDKTLNLLNFLTKIVKNLFESHHVIELRSKKVLELGPEGILVPQISSVEDAKNAIDFSFFPSLEIKVYHLTQELFNFSPENLDDKKLFNIIRILNFLFN